MRSVSGAILLGGCFTPAATPLAVDVLDFSNKFSESSDILLSPFEYPLTCPDGAPASFYAVYKEGISTAMPLVIVFHAGAFDYVPAPHADDPLTGDHFQGEPRLNAEWASEKVFETFGLLPGGPETTTEVNGGSLPAALAEAGAIALYPANCWGDLWHNEQGFTVNDGIDVFYRNGRAMAGAMAGVVSPDPTGAERWRETLGLDALPVSIDASGVYLVGLGEGGRAVVELYKRSADPTITDKLPPVKGVIIDSTMDDLTPIVDDPAFIAGYADGLQRIYSGDISLVAEYSLASWIAERGNEVPMQVWYSSADPQVPASTLGDLITLAPSYPSITLHDTGAAAHVQLNNDYASAAQAVEDMLGTAAVDTGTP